MADGDRSGQSGFMGMFLFDQSVPERDGSLENDVIVHENAHGITNRMTGGGTAQYVNILFHTNRTILRLCISSQVLADYGGPRPGGGLVGRSRRVSWHDMLGCA